MSRLKKSNLASLYPRRKSYEEIEKEHEQRMKKRQPHLPALKLSAYTSSAAIIILLAYKLISFTIIENISAVETVMFGVFASVLVAIIGVVTVGYFVLSISELAKRTLYFRAPLYIMLYASLYIIGVLYARISSYEQDDIITLLALFAGQFFVIWGLSAALIRYQK